MESVVKVVQCHKPIFVSQQKLPMPQCPFRTDAFLVATNIEINEAEHNKGWVDLVKISLC